MTAFYRSPHVKEQADPLILTALMDEAATDKFQAWRRAHYPERLNRVPAHLTLFHALPGQWLEDVEEVLAERCWALDPLPARALGLRFTGHGIAVEIEAPALAIVRRELAQDWSAALSPQDRQRFAPHVTIQNKVPPPRARRTLEGLEAIFQPFGFAIEGLQLWHYRGGPWEEAGRFPFGAGPA